MNSTRYPPLNVSAELRFYGVTYQEPGIERNGRACSDTICGDVELEGDTLFVNVSHFSTYRVVELYEESSSEDSGGSSGGSSGGGSSGGSSSFIPETEVVDELVVEEVLVEELPEEHKIGYD